MSGSAASLPRTPGRPGPLRLLGDDRLVRLAAAGNERAFAALYERHAPALFRYCRSILQHEQDAQDALQTAMTRALTALGRGVPEAPVRPWLFRIAHNEAISLVRRRRLTQELEDAHSVAGAPLEARLEERRRLALLVADLQELPDRQRAALVMRELSGLSHEEIAAALEISLSAAKQAIFEARVGLQEFARGREMDCAEVQRLISDQDGRVLRARPVRAHLRSCGSCRALREAISTRREDLAALAPPVPAAALAGVLAKIFGGGGHGGGAGGLASATAGKAGAGALAVKLATGTAIVATVGMSAPHAVRPLLADKADRPPAPRSAGVTSRSARHQAPIAPAPGARAAADAQPSDGTLRARTRRHPDAVERRAAARSPEPASAGRPPQRS
ncbi:MAG TPA: RNA polymerase sigma factor, partial [Solirubrobacteraceae bacterium]